MLLVLIYRPSPRTLPPSEVALGTPGSQGSVIYLAPMGPELARETAQARVPVHSAVPKAPKQPKPVDRQREAAHATAANVPVETAHGGSPWGSRVPGTPIIGPEVIPALPEVFPDPPVTAAELPSGIQGDVIVEVTIDEQGNVVEEKLLKGIGYGIEEKVLAVLRQWHFRPATQKGVTIASQHIVHFHYPS
jgi:TonB family protein